MPHQPSSMVLFLTNCSLTKALDGVTQYNPGPAITSDLPEPLRDRLLNRRANVFQLVKNAPGLQWQGTPVSELAHNRELASGPDLGGRHAAAYLPALDRYEGRLFQALGAQGKQRLMESEHHTLFLSGLYGLLRPTEPVQLYSCPLAPQVAKLWRKDSLLTDVLCDYIKRYGIARIIDLTAIDAYRQLIDWERITETKTDVLHCFDEMAAGDPALTSFGKCLATELLGLSEDEIVALPSEHRFGTVILRSLARPWRGCPQRAPKSRLLRRCQKPRQQPKLLASTSPGGWCALVASGMTCIGTWASSRRYVKQPWTFAAIRQRPGSPSSCSKASSADGATVLATTA